MLLRVRSCAVPMVVALAFLAGCGGSDEGAHPATTVAATTATSTTVTSTTVTGRAPAPARASAPELPAGDLPAPPVSAPPSWVVGSEPLPLRADGYGEIGPTPEPLLDRRLPTVSALPAPVSDQFEWEVRRLDEGILARMGETWMPGCPVGPVDLRYLTVSFWGFDGGHHTGELVVHRDVAEAVVWVFGRIHAARFPIEGMRLITGADLDAAPTGDGNNSAGFVCRPIRGGGGWSAHALGLAVDINPFHNPYRRGDVVLPERASAYLDRGWRRPGMITPGDVVTDAFDGIGWTWGGTWSNPDLMHFSATGR